MVQTNNIRKLTAAGFILSLFDFFDNPFQWTQFHLPAYNFIMRISARNGHEQLGGSQTSRVREIEII